MKLFNIVCLVLFFGLILANNIYIDIEEDYDDVIIPATLIKPATLINRYVGDIWTNCTTNADDASIISVVITPDPPAIGQNVTITVIVNLKKIITSGTIHVNVKWSIFPISRTLDLCTVVRQAGQTCPLMPGDHITHTVHELIPSSIPSGHYTGNIRITDQN
uniref:ML domain-containing protein n=1 Tax=Salmonella sp. s51228 TaxID=3159652 RepID=UPI0039812752